MLLSPPLQKSYENISQRMLSGYMIAFPDFSPVKSDVSEKAQETFYGIMKNILLTMYHNPEKMGLPVSKDDYFKAFMCGNQRPELDKLMKEIRTRINDFYRILCLAGKIGIIDDNNLTIDIQVIKDTKSKIKKEYAVFLTSIGIPTSVTKEKIIFTLDNQLIKAWQLLAQSTLHIDVFNFACSLFNNDFRYYQNNIESIHGLPKEYFTPYMDELIAHGFYDDSYGLNIRVMGKVSGFMIQFHDRFDEQFYFMANNCQGVKAMLADFDNLPTAIQDYLVFSCRKCNSCMDCTKGGKSKVFTMNVNHGGQDVALCPLFNCREWFAEDVNDQFMMNLIEYIKLQEIYGKAR